MKGQSILAAACVLAGVLGVPFAVDQHNVKVVTVVETVVVTKTCTVNAEPSPNNYVPPPIVPVSNPEPEHNPEEKPKEFKPKLQLPSPLHYDIPVQPTPEVHVPVYVPPPPPVKPQPKLEPEPEPPATHADIPLPLPPSAPASPPTYQVHLPEVPKEAKIPKPVYQPVQPEALIKPEPPAKPQPPAKPHFVAVQAAAAVFNYSSNSGKATYYDPGMGSCGRISLPTDMHVAFPHALMEQHETGNPNNNPLCGQKLYITRNGVTIQVEIWDKCPGCDPDTVDLTPTAFEKIAQLAEGRVQISWKMGKFSYQAS